MAGTDVDALQREADAFGHVTAPLAERQVNAAVKSLLEGKREDEIGDPGR